MTEQIGRDEAEGTEARSGRSRRDEGEVGTEQEGRRTDN